MRLFDIYGFVEQDKKTYGLGFNLILKRDTNKNARYRTAATAEARIIEKIIARYVEKFTPNLDNQQPVANPTLSKIPTELYYE